MKGIEKPLPFTEEYDKRYCFAETKRFVGLHRANINALLDVRMGKSEGVGGAFL